MNGVDAIFGRIASIESRFAPVSPAAVPTTPPSLTEFDPFGAEYQKAVDAVQTDAYAELQPAATPSPAAAGAWSAAATAAPSSSNAASFDQVSAAVAGVAAPAGKHAVGGYGAMPVPDALQQIGNGRIPSDALFQIGQGSHRLYAPAAASWKNMVAAASADGIDLRLTDSYRSYDEQVDLAQRKGLYSEGGLAATPGTSNHGWGLAVDADVNDPATREWLQVNGPRFGWVEAVPREPWHWEFRPNQV
jgi:hypothetical protein